MPGVFSSGGDTECVVRTHCFVLMPFATSFNATFRLIQRCCKDQELSCDRADDDVNPGKITRRIYEKIASAGIIVADVTGLNPNVLYEVGLAHAISDRVILLTQKISEIPFDLRDFLHIEYSNSFEGAEKLAVDLTKVLTALVRSPAPSRASAEIVGSSEESVDGALGALTDYKDLTLAHLYIQSARAQGDVPLARTILEKVAKEVLSGAGGPGEIGNCAIEAESLGEAVYAEQLYEEAIRRNGEHVNNLQCYASFILDSEDISKEKLAHADALLKKLETLPARQERTRALRAQYLTIVSSPGSPDFQAAIDAMLSEDLNSVTAAAPILAVLIKTKQLPQVRVLLDRLRSKVPISEIVVLDRVLADSLANADERSLKEEAAILYRKILNDSSTDDPEVKHNLATILHDIEPKSKEIMELWRSAYQALPSNLSIRKAFAQYLFSIREGRLASLVLEGKSL